MKWLRRVALAVGVLALAGGLVLAFLWWRLRQEPEDFGRASTMDAAEAERVLRDLGHEAPVQTPAEDRWDPRGGWGRKRPPSKAAPPRPYRLALTDRQVAAIVVRQVVRSARGQVGDVRVAVREHDLFAAGRLRGTALSGSVVSITAVPSAGARGRLCLALGQARVGGQAIPAELLEELGARSGQKMPRTVCMSARAIGLPGPVRAVRVTGGRVVVEGSR